MATLNAEPIAKPAVGKDPSTAVADAVAEAQAGGVARPVAEFNIEEMVDNFAIALYGARRRGKSVLMHHIMSLLWERFDECYLFSNTAGLQGNIWHFIPKENRIKGLDEAKLDELMSKAMKERKAIESEFSDEQQEQKDKALDEKMKRRMVILDDIVSDKKTQRSDILDNYFTLGRHAYMSIAILSQNASAKASLSISARGNLDYCFTTAMNMLDDFERLARYYFGIEGWKAGVQRIVQLTSTPFSFAVSDMQLQDKQGNLNTYTTTITAPPLEEQDKSFKIGKDQQEANKGGGEGDGKKAALTLQEGIKRMVELDGADGAPLLMVLPGAAWDDTMYHKGIMKLDRGLKPRADNKRFTKEEDEAKDSKEVHDEEDMEIDKMPAMAWESDTLMWDANPVPTW